MSKDIQQQKIDLTMKVKSIDQWKRLNCTISEGTYNAIVEQTSDWMDKKSPLSVWVDNKENKLYFIKIKLSQWDVQPCNFQKMQHFIGSNCFCTIFAKEYNFTDKDGKHLSGWSATLKGGSIKRV